MRILDISLIRDTSAGEVEPRPCKLNPRPAAKDEQGYQRRLSIDATLDPILQSNKAAFEPRRAPACPSNRGPDRCLKTPIC